MGTPHRVSDHDSEVAPGAASPWRQFALAYAALAVFFGWYASLELRRYPVGAVPAAAIYVCFILLAGLYLAPGFTGVRERLVRRYRIEAAVLAFLVPYLIYAAGAGDFRWIALGKLFAMCALPLGLFDAAPVSERQRLNWQDVVVLAWLYVPVQFHLLSGIWNFPVNLDFMARLFVVATGAWAFLVVRGLEGAGYKFTVSPGILRDAAVAFAGFSVIAIPLGFLIRFIGWNPQWRGLPQFVADYATIFLFVAIAEELFFRGLLQNLVEGSVGSRYGAQALVSALFGLSHIQHAPAPNWRYVILATVAGWFYGMAYRRHRSLMASAGVHAAVDTLWRTFMTLGGT